MPLAALVCLLFAVAFAEAVGLYLLPLFVAEDADPSESLVLVAVVVYFDEEVVAVVVAVAVEFVFVASVSAEVVDVAGVVAVVAAAVGLAPQSVVATDCPVGENAVQSATSCAVEFAAVVAEWVEDRRTVDVAVAVAE